MGSTREAILPGMSLELETSTTSFIGDGGTTVFPVPFGFLDPTHLRVTLDTGGAPVTQILGVHYLITGTGMPEASAAVQFMAAPAFDQRVTITRQTPIVQDINFRTQGSFNPDTHESALDHRTMVEQELSDRLGALEAGGNLGTATAGDGLDTAGSTWFVGQGVGIRVDGDSVAVDFGTGTTVTVDATASSNGGGATVARFDHKHQVATAAPGATGVQVGNAAAAGSSASLAKADHVHAVARGTPVPVNKSAAAAGTAATFAGSDHKHDVDTAPAIDLTDSTNAEGNATTLARSNHTHSHGARGGGTLHAVATTATAGFMSAADKTKTDAWGGAFTGVVTTTTATPATAAFLTMPGVGTVVIEIFVVGSSTSASKGFGSILAGTFKSVDGVTVAAVGTASAELLNATNAAWTAQYLISGNQILVSVAGENALNVNWKVSGRYLFVS